MELADVKVLLGITDASKDAQIEALIPVVEDFVDNEFNTGYTEEGGYPPRTQGVIADLIGHRLNTKPGVSSSKLGDAADAYELYPEAILARLPRKVKIV